MEKTFVRFVKYRGYSFSDKTIKSEWSEFSFFAIENFSFFFVETESNDTPFQLRHWYIWWFTKNKRRKIQMTFSALAYTEEERRNLIKLVNQIFAPPSNPNYTDNIGYHPMEFTDISWVSRQFNAKVINRPQEKDLWNTHIISFDVELITEWWSCIYWKDLQTLLDRNYIRWVSLPTSLSLSFSDYAVSNINYTWISNSNVKCTVTALQDNATIWSIQILSIRPWSYTRMFFNIDLNIWDILIIDPNNYLVELNWIDITWDLELDFWNNFPILEIWDNKLVVDTWKPTQTVDVLWERRETRC